MDDNLDVYTNGRRPQLFRHVEDDLIFLGNRRTSSTFKLKTTSIFRQMEDDLNISGKWKMTSLF
jgi:hypothetical protein